MLNFVILILASLGGGIVNALAGGGTFLVFPALLLTGMAPVRANATASLALLPGAIVSTWVYRDGIKTMSRNFVLMMLAASLAGSLVGSILLMRTSNASFASLVPWLLLIAAAVFTASPWIRKAAARANMHESLPVLLIGQTVLGVYGGYFGAGMSIMMMALFIATTSLGIHAAGGLRTICATFVNILAVGIFASRGAIDYKFGIPMLIASVVGGYWSAHTVKKLDAETVRRWILIYAWVLTAWFFVKMLIGS